MCGVPILAAIDEHGVVRSVRPPVETFEADFLKREFANDAPDAVPPPQEFFGASDLERQARATNTAGAWRRLENVQVLWGGPDRVNEALQAFAHAIEICADDAAAPLCLGVRFGMWHELADRQANDIRQAVEEWGRALALKPNHYIWGRRIQQDGPRLDRSYPFYDGVDKALAEIAARGEKPAPLLAQLCGAAMVHLAHSALEERGRSTAPLGRRAGGMAGLPAAPQRPAKRPAGDERDAPPGVRGVSDAGRPRAGAPEGVCPVSCL